MKRGVKHVHLSFSPDLWLCLDQSHVRLPLVCLANTPTSLPTLTRHPEEAPEGQATQTLHHAFC